MDNKRIVVLLESLDACPCAIEWVGRKSLTVAWKSCVRADWMCWLLVRMDEKKGWPSKKIVRNALCDCAQTSMPIYAKYYPNDNRPQNAIDTARRYADGTATEQELDAARDAARDAQRAELERRMLALAPAEPREAIPA